MTRLVHACGHPLHPWKGRAKMKESACMRTVRMIIHRIGVQERNISHILPDNVAAQQPKIAQVAGF